MIRPNHLPIYSNPPLYEVVVGVQFDPVEAPITLFSGKHFEVWKDEFPIIKEVPPLEPQFETFGGNFQKGGITFNVGNPPVSPRIWFISADETHLAQLQKDRFLLNWKRINPDDSYPHFELILQKFKKMLNDVSSIMFTEYQQDIKINQIEVSYFNFVEVENFSELSEWLGIQFDNQDGIESMNLNVNQIIRSENGDPIARLNTGIDSAIAADNKKKAYRMELTYRGAPFGSTIDKSLESILSGRDCIVSRFDRLVTERAKQGWGRSKNA